MDADDEEELLQSMYDHAFSCTRAGEERRWQVAIEGPGADGFPSLTALRLELCIPRDYPAAPPSLRVARSRGLSDTDLSAVLCRGREEAEAAGGEACAYQIVEACRTALASCGGGACPVCFEAFTVQDTASSAPALALDCGHAFHSPCVGPSVAPLGASRPALIRRPAPPAPWFESQQRDFLRGVEKDPGASAAAQRARAAQAEVDTKRERKRAGEREEAEAKERLRQLEAAAREAAEQADGPTNGGFRTRIADAQRQIERAAQLRKRAARGAAEAAQRLEALAARAEEARAALRCRFECPVCRSAVAQGTAEALLPAGLLHRDGAAAVAMAEEGTATGAGIRGGPSAVPTVPDSLRAKASAALRDLLSRDTGLRRAVQRVQQRNSRVRAAQERTGGLIGAPAPEGSAQGPSPPAETPCPATAAPAPAGAPAAAASRPQPARPGQRGSSSATATGGRRRRRAPKSRPAVRPGARAPGPGGPSPRAHGNGAASVPQAAGGADSSPAGTSAAAPPAPTSGSAGCGAGDSGGGAGGGSGCGGETPPAGSRGCAAVGARRADEGCDGAAEQTRRRPNTEPAPQPQQRCGATGSSAPGTGSRGRRPRPRQRQRQGRKKMSASFE